MNINLISKYGCLNIPLAPEFFEKMLKYSAFIQNLVSEGWDANETIRLELESSALGIINFITFISEDMKSRPKEALEEVEELMKYFGIDTGMLKIVC